MSNVCRSASAYTDDRHKMKTRRLDSILNFSHAGSKGVPGLGGILPVSGKTKGGLCPTADGLYVLSAAWSSLKQQGQDAPVVMRACYIATSLSSSYPRPFSISEGGGFPTSASARKVFHRIIKN